MTARTILPKRETKPAQARYRHAGSRSFSERNIVSIGTILLLALLLLIGAVPIWPHGKGWVMAGSGYDPTVNKHREHLMEKLDIQNTARLTRCAIGADIIEPSVPLTIA